MRRKDSCNKPLLWLTISGAAALILSFLILGAYLAWRPGVSVTDGRHDLGANGIWLQHGWLGDDEWFAKTKKEPSLFRDKAKIRELGTLLDEHHILYVFPHLCPCSPEGLIPAVDKPQAERFLAEMTDFRVIPWVGGILGKQVFLGSPEWRKSFITSIVSLLTAYPAFSGIHINVEPVPTGNGDFIKLLRELRRSLPQDAILSVAAYPPPTILHPFPRVHWQEKYFKAIAQEVDQMVIMMYDTGLRLQKPYIHLMSSWTREALGWAGHTDVLLGLPVYEGKGTRHHFSQVENLPNALAGIHRGLTDLKVTPPAYRGIALYSEWEMDAAEWAYLRNNFLKNDR